MASVSMKLLLESGVHFGHHTRRWNPRMKRFIFTQRNGIHILDLQQTVSGLDAATTFVREVVANGEDVLFVGTKKQAQETIAEESQRAGQHYVNQRWLGGTLTNFQTIQSRIQHLQRLKLQEEQGEFDLLPKKEATKLQERLDRLQRMLGGIEHMGQPPGALYIVDTTTEHIAVAEARRLSIPTVALVDTNADPTEVDYPIPANDDAIRAIRLLTSHIADACLEARQEREASLQEEISADAELAEEEALGVDEFAYVPEADETSVSAESDEALAAVDQGGTDGNAGDSQ